MKSHDKKEKIKCLGLSLCGGPCDDSCPAFRDNLNPKFEISKRYNVHIEDNVQTDFRTMQAWDIENFICSKCEKKNISIMALKTKEGVVKIKIMCRTCLNQVSVNYERLDKDK